MQYRIRTLMILVISASILLAVWHVLPQGRVGLLYFAVPYAMVAPVLYLSRSQPATWSMRRKLGFLAYSLAVGIIYAAAIGWIIVHDPGLSQRIATWPG